MVAIIALVLSMGGVSYGLATGSVDSREILNNTVRTQDLRNGHVRQFDINNGAVRGRHINGGAVNGSDVANNSLTGSDINQSTLGELQPKADLLFATVAPAGVNPVILRGRGATAVTRVVAGSFNVTFNRSVTNCTWLASYGPPGNTFVDAKFATVRGRDPATQANIVTVVIRDAAGAQVDGLGFHVSALCP